MNKIIVKDSKYMSENFTLDLNFATGCFELTIHKTNESIKLHSDILNVISNEEFIEIMMETILNFNFDKVCLNILNYMLLS